MYKELKEEYCLPFLNEVTMDGHIEIKFSNKIAEPDFDKIIRRLAAEFQVSDSETRLLQGVEE